MLLRKITARFAALGVALVITAPIASHSAEARSRASHAPSHSVVQGHVRAIQIGMGHGRRAYAGRSRGFASYGGRLQCVPFARENTGIEISGNASAWWQNAEGVYERGARPEVGSVLNFRANGRMRMGHVAVVSNVIDGRNVTIDHANWWGPGAGRGGISRDITVVDVSERNDWTAVRVALGHTGEFGSVYPTYGFIYDRPDRGTLVANSGVAPTRVPTLNAPPRDLRPAAERGLVAPEMEEVAEAEDEPRARGGRHFQRFAGHQVRGGHAVHGGRTFARHSDRFAPRSDRGVVTRVRAPATSGGHAHHHRRV